MTYMLKQHQLVKNPEIVAHRLSFDSKTMSSMSNGVMEKTMCCSGMSTRSPVPSRECQTLAKAQSVPEERQKETRNNRFYIAKEVIRGYVAGKP